MDSVFEAYRRRTADLKTRFWRFWDGLIKRVRRRAETGHIDQAEIERLFGWSEDS